MDEPTKNGIAIKSIILPFMARLWAKARLTIPPVDKEMLSGILNEIEETMAKGTNPQ